MEACFWSDLQATPEDIRPWVVRRWSVEVTCEECRAHLALGKLNGSGRTGPSEFTTPVRLALFSLVTVMALQWSQGGHMPVPVTAW